VTSPETAAQAASGTPADKPLPRKLRHKQWSGAMLGLLIGVGGLVAGRLGHLYPHFDVFAQLGAQFVAMVIAFSIALFMVRYKGLIGVVLTTAMLIAYGAWPHLASAHLQQGPYILSAGERVLRVAHFNTYTNNGNSQAIANEVLRLDADVATLIEMNDAKKKAVLTLLKARYPHNFDCTGVDYCDMVIVSKYPIMSAGGMSLWEGPPIIKAVLGGEMTGVTVVGVHTTRFPFSNAQLSQIRALVKKLDEMPGKLVVIGDFNATPFSRITQTLEQGASLMRVTELPTWPTLIALPQLAIDHAFISRDFRVVGNQQIGEAAGSDHYPIVLTLAFKPAP
jgi:endonuclease/exonuclease/phosphatase (EEP) superfamily protein YafD